MPRLTKNELELVKRPRSTAWYIRGTLYRGEHRHECFESTGTTDRGAAEARRKVREAEIWQLLRDAASSAAIPSLPKVAAKVWTFADAVDSYMERNPGAKPSTTAPLTAMLAYLGDKPLDCIDQNTLDELCRPAAGVVSASAGNARKKRAVQTPLTAVLNHAHKRRWLPYVPKFDEFKIPRPQTDFLLPAQATALVRNAAHHLRPLLVAGIGTGCRVSELLELEWRYVDLLGKRMSVWQKDNSGSPRERIVELESVVLKALGGLPHRDGLVFRPARHNRFELSEDGYKDYGREGGGQFKTAFGNACGRAGLPGRWIERKRPDRPSLRARFAPEFTTHGLRHTWASWHYVLHKDLVRLQEEGGWYTAVSCRRYAHRCSDVYKPDVRDWLDAKIDLGLDEVRERRGKSKVLSS